MPSTNAGSDLTSREILKAIIALKPARRCGLWLGNPHADSWPGLHRYFGTTTEEELRRKLGDDYRWISPSFAETTFPTPASKGIFSWNWAAGKASHGQAGPLAEVEDASELERFDWPDPAVLDFSETLRALDAAGPHYRASGFWTPFYHNVMDLFGMENYLTKMYTHPEVVLAVTDKVCEFYYQANERYFALAGDLIDGYFFGNDFGTQLDLIVGPKSFDKFILPWFRRFTDQAHGHGYQVILHSCGSIYRVIDRLIDAGVECLHPLQALARHMDAAYLAEHYKRPHRLPRRHRHPGRRSTARPSRSRPTFAG